MHKRNWTPNDIFQLSCDTWANCVLQVAVKIDLFTNIDSNETANQGLTISELAKYLKCNERALSMLVTALVSLNFLERKGKMVCLTEFSKKYLSVRSDDYYGFIIKHNADVMPAWIRLDEVIKSGKYLPEHSSEKNEEERQSFLMGMFNVARQQADMVAEALDLTGRESLLDLGGGPGTYAVYFSRRYPQIRATVFDLPTTQEFATNIFTRYGLSERINFVSGNFLQDELPKQFDVAWLSQVLHAESNDNASRLVKQATESLNSGGLMAIQEFVLDDDLCGPIFPALFSLNMLLLCPEGAQSYTRSELMTMMSDAGLKNLRVLEVELPRGCRILLGDKE